MIYIYLCLLISNLQCSKFIPKQNPPIYIKQIGNFVCINNFFSKNLQNQMKILDIIPKPWTFVRQENNIIIYKPISTEHQEALIEILNTYGLECWVSYA